MIYMSIDDIINELHALLDIHVIGAKAKRMSELFNELVRRFEVLNKVRSEEEIREALDKARKHREFVLSMGEQRDEKLFSALGFQIAAFQWVLGES